MKIVMIGNVIIKLIFMACVTTAAIYFNNAWILFWYICLPFIGYQYREKPIKKGSSNE